MCLDNNNIYIVGKKINTILVYSIDILVADMKEIATIRQGYRGYRPQVIKASLELSGEDCFKCRVLLQTTAWQFLIFRRKICFLLLETLTDHSPAVSDRC